MKMSEKKRRMGWRGKAAVPVVMLAVLIKIKLISGALCLIGQSLTC